jgi:rod shape-determining protein MreC
MMHPNQKKDRFTQLLLVGVILVSLIVVFDLRTSTASQSIQSITREVLAPLQNWSAEVFTWWKEMFDTVQNFRTLKDENAQLREHNTLLLQAYSRLEALEAENNRLREMMKFDEENLQYEIAIAKIIGWPNSNWSSRYILGLGSTDGIAVNMVAVSSQGVLGKIIYVTEHTAELMLLTDELAAVGARVLPGGYLSIVSGQGANASTLKLSLLPGSAEIKIGDKVVTSGLSDLYPEGLTIGLITKIDDNKTGMHQTAEVEPAVRVSSLYEVMILYNIQSTEQPVSMLPEEATP